MTAIPDLFGGSTELSPALILTAHYGTNDLLIAAAARLHIRDSATVLDCTWGKGNFWRRADTARFRLIGTDLNAPAMARADFRALPFRDASLDVVVLDPPYIQDSAQPRVVHQRYRNAETTPKFSHSAILDLYRAGMAEGRRVLRPGGQLWVKCQDTVDGRRQRWNGIAVHQIALSLGLCPLDMFVLVNPTPPGRRFGTAQMHARRNHSYLWIFNAPA